MNRIDVDAVNALRVLAADEVQKANSGHPGLPLGAAPAAYTVWAYEMKHNPKNYRWENRDRFILSGGHGSALLYALLHLFGYGLTKNDLENFRQLDSLTPGHPEYGHTVGVEATTGPLGAGMGMAVGMAIAEAHLSAVFNRPGYDVVDHYTFVLGGDGCLMEGISSEAFSLAGTLKLNKLIVLYDSNRISIEGSTDIAFTEDVGKRMEAFGFQVLTVEDGNDVDAGHLLTANHQGDAVTFQIFLEDVHLVDGQRDDVAVHVGAHQNDRAGQIASAAQFQHLLGVIAEQQRGGRNVQIGVVLIEAGQNVGHLIQRDDGKLHVRGDGGEIDFTGSAALCQRRADVHIDGDFFGTDGSVIHRHFLLFGKRKRPGVGLSVRCDQRSSLCWCFFCH